ncbi:MAG: putative mycofactocin system creatinine amidohydrolase family protein MftE [Anaerolineales bacterium]|nr:putative mycofactocin system creatinine amidohydrolase family protein MftE [Anaerolineales bacterium]
MDRYKLAEMNWPEVEEALSQGVDTVVVTFGSTEQHGLHLPLATDSLWGEALGERVTRKLGNACLAPALRIGCSEHHMAFPGTITLRKETFVEVIADYCQSLARHGFRNIVLIPTHGGNFAPLAEAVESLAGRLPDVNIIAYTDLMELLDASFRIATERGVTPAEAGGHAGEWETSMILTLRPELVAMDQAQAGYVGDMKSVASVVFEQGFRAVTEIGVLGDPEKAGPASGEAYLEALTELLVTHVQARRR